MVAGKRAISSVLNKKMHFMRHKWPWLEDELLDQQIECVGQQTRNSNPQHHSPTFPYNHLLTRGNGIFPPGKGFSPQDQEHQGPAKNEPVGTKDHQSIEPGVFFRLRVNSLKECIVQVKQG